MLIPDGANVWGHGWINRGNRWQASCGPRRVAVRSIAMARVSSKNRLPVLSRVRRAAATDEESRAYLQSRLGVFSMLVFWTVVAELTLLTVMYRLYPRIQPANANAISAAGGSGLAALAVLWRGVIA